MALLPSDQDYPDGWIDDLTKTFVARARPMFPNPLCPGFMPADIDSLLTHKVICRLPGGTQEIGTEFGLKPVDGDIKPERGDIWPDPDPFEASTSFFGDGSAFGDDAGFGVIDGGSGLGGDAGSVLIEAGVKSGIGPEEWEKTTFGGDHGIGGSDEIKDYIVGDPGSEGIGRNDEGIGGSNGMIKRTDEIQVKKTSEIVIEDSIIIGRTDESIGGSDQIWPENDDG